MIGIFVSYRREDTAGHAGRLAEQLEARFGREDVFMDIDAISPGEDFEQRIAQTLHHAKVTLVLIGEKWLELKGPDGQRRIDAPDDYVRKEIAAALQRPETTVIPVLVERGEMPLAAELPDEIAELAKRHAVRLGNERWRYDVKQLTDRIDELTATGTLARGWRYVRRRKAPVVVAVGVVAAAVAAVVAASSGGSAAATVRVDDIPLSNPPAQFHQNVKTLKDFQVPSTKPWIELKIHNLGNQTADITRARITVADILRIRPCFSAGGSALSAIYNTELPTTKGATIEPVINEQVKPDAIDRFRITFDLPLKAYGPGGLDVWLMRLHVQLLHDARTTPVDGGDVMLAFFGAPDPRDNSMWWTKLDTGHYASLVKTWTKPNIDCVINQTPRIERFLAQPGRRSPELVSFASQLTTQR